LIYKWRPLMITRSHRADSISKIIGGEKMPYIEPKARMQFDPLIDQLAERIVAEAKTAGYDGAFAGLLHYTCTRLALQIVRIQFGQIRYWLIALVTGTFQNISEEFYRRIGIPYEEKQMEKNGDVDLYRLLLKESAGQK
jgi:hypothetical protein